MIEPSRAMRCERPVNLSSCSVFLLEAFFKIYQSPA
jgi:hypothetical protein